MAGTYDLTLTLVPGPGDPPFQSRDGQDVLGRFHRSILPDVEVFPCGPSAWYLGDFFIKLAGTIGPALITGIAGWLHGRSGRKVRLKVGDIEAEAQTTEEVEKLLAHALEIQQNNQPKVIHGP